MPDRSVRTLVALAGAGLLAALACYGIGHSGGGSTKKPTAAASKPAGPNTSASEKAGFQRGRRAGYKATYKSALDAAYLKELGQ
ncbi:MAG: hypothetical protein QOD53_456 [Thermoleophilaceae bacterium]|nr:hypothetical protein [Thermoleophilaceae bacterium]